MGFSDAGAVMSASVHTGVQHRFAVGSTVHLSRLVLSRDAVQGPYEVLAQLPQRDGEFQYRIKSGREPYQRIVREDELEPDSSLSA
jgi:hypothetical protein